MNLDNQTAIAAIKSTLDRPIVMIGLMAAGKTRIGKELASVLGVEFADADEEIEKAAGMSIADIFECYGEGHFRDGERRVMSRLIDNTPKVVATGGGAVMDKATADLIFGNAIAIWVRADINTLVERTSQNNKRPLLKDGNPHDILKRLADVRYPIYQKAPIMLETDEGPMNKIIETTLGLLQDYLNR